MQTLHRVATVLQGEDCFVEEAAQSAINSVLIECCEHKIILDVPRLVDYHIAVQRRLIRLALGKIFTGHIEYAWVERMLQVAKGKRNTLHDVGKGIRVQCGIIACFPTRHGILARRSSPHTWHGASSERMDFLAAWSLCVRVCSSRASDSHIALDADKLGNRPLLRSAAVGDRFRPFGMRGQKKLSDFLIDEKYPRILRDEVLVLESAGQIAWVVGMRISDAFCVGPSSRRIALIQFSVNA